MLKTVSETELKKMRRIAAEAVRRGIAFDDWESDCVSRLVYRGEELTAASALCSAIWRVAVEEDQKSL